MFDKESEVAKPHEDCLFCKIVRGEAPCMKLLETDTMLAFMDIMPIAPGHCLVIPKYHAVTLDELPEEHMVDLLPACAMLAKATGFKEYNIAQSNGKGAYQSVFHVHFHVIPKPPGVGETQGLVMRWPWRLSKDSLDMEQTKAKYNEMLGRLQST